MPHSPDHNRADKWTIIAAGAEAITGFISNTYWLATVFDIATGREEDIVGISFYALGFGVIAAACSASGAAYSHFILNTQHQLDSSHKQLEEGHAIVAHDEVKLSKLQHLALAGDYLSHIGEVTGPLTFVVDLASKSNLPRWGRGIAQCSATLFGAIASVANVRTCKQGMLNSNRSSHGYQQIEAAHEKNRLVN